MLNNFVYLQHENRKEDEHALSKAEPKIKPGIDIDAKWIKKSRTT